MPKHLAIFDTTLRDGLQTPYLPPISRTQRLRIAQMLERMRVDIIEAGFPSSSPENFASVECIAGEVKESVVCALALATKESISCAAEALAQARQKRVHIFLGSSKTHLGKLRFTQEEMLEHATSSVYTATKYFGEIEFSPEDAGRTHEDFLCRVVEAVIKAGVTVINIPDTVGYCMPAEYGTRIRSLMERVPNADKATWSVHCHDDFGCATANTLMGVLGGAQQAECTLYNIGERAGNAALEEVVMAIRKRQDIFACDTRIDTTLLWEASRMVEEITGVAIPPNKAVVGQHAFAHESGIHQDGVLKDPATYQVMLPGEVGWQGRSLPLGPQSGRNALRARLLQMHIELSENVFAELFKRFKDYADTHGTVDDKALQTIVHSLQNPAET